MIRRPPRSTQSRSAAASDVYKRQVTAPVVVIALTPAIFSRGGPPGEKHREHPGVACQFGMERRRGDVALAHEHGVAVPPREHLHGLIDGGDSRGADEDGFERLLAAVSYT